MSSEKHQKIVPYKERKDSKKKQVEAKLLDMDWVFTVFPEGSPGENNAIRLIEILAETSNDAIFGTA